MDVIAQHYRIPLHFVAEHLLPVAACTYGTGAHLNVIVGVHVAQSI